jgi:hypothetical protein
MRMHTLRNMLLALTLLCGCSSTQLVSVPPRMDLHGYGTLGIIDFTSNGNAAINARATRRFEEQIQAAQPGTRFVELGSRESVLAALNSTQLDLDALKNIGNRFGVDGVFLGDIVYSDPKTDIRINDLTKLDGGVRTEVRGDISSRLVETRTGAGVWSSSAWARRQVGRLEVSSTQGVSGSTSSGDPREEMVPDLVRWLTQDFRPTTVRQTVKK